MWVKIYMKIHRNFLIVQFLNLVSGRFGVSICQKPEATSQPCFYVLIYLIMSSLRAASLWCNESTAQLWSIWSHVPPGWYGCHCRTRDLDALSDKMWSEFERSFLTPKITWQRLSISLTSRGHQRSIWVFGATLVEKIILKREKSTEGTKWMF